MSVESASSIMNAYRNAEIIQPPGNLSPVYLSFHQTDDDIKELALTMALMQKNHGPSLFNTNFQLFEVPQVVDQGGSRGPYFNLGYSYPNDPELGAWNRGRCWLKLEDNTDFSCRKCFAKVFEYEGGVFARQWGDGTILEKLWHTREGATPAVRFIDPAYLKGKRVVKAVWIRKLEQEVPTPFHRFPSTHYYGVCESGDESADFNDLCNLDGVENSYKEIYQNLKAQKQELEDLEGSFSNDPDMLSEEPVNPSTLPPNPQPSALSRFVNVLRLPFERLRA